MIKKVLIFYILILSLNSKAQNWTPLDTGIKNYIPYGLLADNLRGNLFAFGNTALNGLNVWRKNKWETWYSNRYWGTYGNEIAYYNNKVMFFYPYYENNDNSKKRTAIIQFTDSTDLDTLKVLQNQDWLPINYSTHNGKIILFNASSIPPFGINSIATFDGDTIIPIGDSTISSVSASCVYNNELYAAAFLKDGYRGVIKKTLTGWQKIYEIQGSLSFIQNMIVYNNRLYIYGGIFLDESPLNLGNSIIAYDGVKFDSLDGGIKNPTGSTGANIYDVAISKGKLYVTGNFLVAGNTKARGIAYWNDTTWCSMANDLDSTGNFFRIENFNDTIYEVAEFYKINGSYNYGWLAKLSNMSLADTCSAPRYPKPINYNYETLICVPNPFTDNITVQIPNSFILSETKFIITNNLGQLLLTFYPASFNQILNLSSLSSSMYFLTVQDNSNKKTVKIIKQ
jgi:hypothetical protein